MLIKGSYNSVRSRNIAVKPRIDSNADQLLHSSTLCILALKLWLQGLYTHYITATITPALSTTCKRNMQSCQIRFTRFYFLKENEKENQFCAVSKTSRMGREGRFQPLCHISILSCNSEEGPTRTTCK